MRPFPSHRSRSFPSRQSRPFPLLFRMACFFSSSRAVILHMSFFSAIVAVILISSSFVVLLAPAVGGSVGAGFTPITPPLRKALIPLVSSLVATSSTSSPLLGVECLGDGIRFGCHRSVRLTLVEGVNNFLNRNFRTRLKNLDRNSIGGRKSHIYVILQAESSSCCRRSTRWAIGSGKAVPRNRDRKVRRWGIQYLSTRLHQHNHSTL